MEHLHTEYVETQAHLERFLSELQGQLNRLLAQKGVRLAFPVEGRVKTFTSIREKCERHALSPENLGEIKDLVGLRVVAVFERDATAACDLIESSLTILNQEDTRGRLGEDQFGYGSVHYQVKLDPSWLAVPSLREFGQLEVEIQVRTVAQHLWALASHVLQYKREQDVPGPIRRTINRAAALLETVDLEFERMLAEREGYLSSLDERSQSSQEPLNRDSFEDALATLWPIENHYENERYSDVLEELRTVGITQLSQLENLIARHRDEILAMDAVDAEQFAREAEDSLGSALLERAKRGVLYTHSGLTRFALSREFPDVPSTFSRWDQSPLRQQPLKP